MNHSFHQIGSHRSIIIFLVFVILGTSASAFAQTDVTGTVIDQDGNPVPGVNVLIKGTPNGTVTDYNGNFKVPMTKDGFLLFMYIGYKKYEQRIELDGRKNVVVKVRLVEDTKKYKKEQSSGIIEDPPLN